MRRHPSKIAELSKLELRKWCIEQAIRWPWSAGSAYGGIGGMPQPAQSPDILARAQQICDWVNK